MLYILPNVLHESQNPRLFLSPQVGQVVAQLDGLICESEKKARWYLKHFDLKVALQQFTLALLNEHTQEYKELLAPIKKGQVWGLLSDAGLACIADPGCELVGLAHKEAICVQAIHGPCSITQALQLSGMSGQRFCFHGYLPRDKKERQDALRQLEKACKQNKETQIFIETPYRNNELLADCLQVLGPHTKLCVVWDIDSSQMGISVKNIAEFKQVLPLDIHKKPAIFLVGLA
jgi:16S rRNA (cytidine1402-2'-O)-methyltransferase